MMNEAMALNMLGRYKLVAILRGVPAEKLIPVAQALHLGGVRLIECTYD
ncbi:MAG: 2-dehydro-3-deoxyphosphogluconate aldolase, partial [Clostridiales bacterium]|nr:2-dehydro-3-deoxyphosphogluconate aldolase [Clostridiales bacterium]